MSKQIKTIQSSDKEEFDKLVNQYLDDDWELVDNGYSIIDGLFTQTIKTKYNHIECYENDNIKYKGNLINGLKHGKWFEYYECGKIERVYNYEYGVRVSTREHFHEDGRLCCIYNFVNDMKHGEYLKFYKNGNIDMKSNFKYGKKDGTELTYYENGQLQIEVSHDNDIFHGKVITYNENGKKKFEGNFKNGKEDGIFIFYDEDGQMSETYYKDGEEVK